MYKKVILNTASQIIGKAISASSTLLVTIIIGNALGEEGFGELTKIFVFVGYFYTAADLGLNSIYVRVADSQNQQKLLRVLSGIRLILASFLAASAIIIAHLIPYDPAAFTGFSPVVKAGITVYSLTIITQALYTTANAFFQKSLRYDLSTIAVVLGALSTLIGVSVAFIAKAPLLVYVAAYIFSGLTAVFTASFFIYKKLKILPLPLFERSQMFKMINESWPIGLSLILNLIYFRIDVLILSNFRSSAEVGIYGLAYQFFEASLAIPIFFSNALYPVLLKVYRTNLKEFKKQISNWLKLLTGLSLVLTLALFMVSELIPFLYEGKFTASVPALKILAIGLPFFFASALIWHALIIAGRQKLLIIIYAAGAVFNLIANLIFIPDYGYLAAAVITPASEAFILTLLTIAYLKSYNQPASRQASNEP